MYIIGTSGHIDHGKTLLIKQLTGIDCDRLPEEKAREMTIDLGFASMEIDPFGTVSIIDVPGHERFIRNMVAGAWGIDLGLLVVAVDDGWMPQTEDHFRVLQLLDTRRLVIVLNKIDLVDDETVSLVRDDVQTKLAGTGFADSAIVPVSSKTCSGIENLKEAIRRNLSLLDKAAPGKKPYLYVDRVFASRGHGTVVTGTLKNGEFRENGTVTILPGKREVKIKRIESHHRHTEQGVPSRRTAMNLAGVSVDDLHRGYIILEKNFFSETGNFLARLKITENVKIKNNQGTELLIGTASLSGKIILLEENAELEKDALVRIRLDAPWHIYPGELFVLTNPGGYRIIGGGMVVIPEYTGVMKRAVLEKRSRLSGYSTENLLNFFISVNRWVDRRRLDSIFREDAAQIDRIIAGLVADKQVAAAGEYILEHNYFETACREIEKALKAGNGLNAREIADRAGLDESVCRALLPGVVDRDEFTEREGKYHKAGAEGRPLEPELKRLSDELNKAGPTGIELKKTTDSLQQKRLKSLVTRGHAVILDGNIVLHKEVYAVLKKRLLLLLDEKEKITVSEARESFGLSRKYTIPLLNRIEDDGLIRRFGDFRVKA